MSNKNWIEPTILPLVCQWTLKDKHFHYNLGLEKYDQWSLSRPHFDANGRSINQIILSSWISILNWHCFVILHWRWSLMWWRFSSRCAWKRKICIAKCYLEVNWLGRSMKGKSVKPNYIQKFLAAQKSPRALLTETFSWDVRRLFWSCIPCAYDVSCHSSNSKSFKAPQDATLRICDVLKSLIKDGNP